MANNITNFTAQAMDTLLALSDQRQALSTQRQTMLELRKADENDRANLAKLLNSINDITFGIQKDKQASANKHSEAVKGLL
ncbi:MAG: hypothetical protein KF760_24425 [Candidatus Eremiobacteraeota bacterium]|nr:hypothetical protein [Candidatus Eremiobacteraeota bacterium]MCW5867526.1 hypothetical protein [Candidatus Eremiobacteraeota bacterium]